MGTPTVLTPELVQRIKELYAERDGRGRRLHTQMSIAKDLSVSETTVLRAIRSMGAYKDAPEAASEQEWAQRAEESAKRLMALLENPEPTKPARDYRAITPALRERLIGYQQWDEEDEKAWTALHDTQTP